VASLRLRADVTVAVITSVYGAYDPVVRPPDQTVDVEWICVTDKPDQIPEPWRVVYEPRPHLHPRMAAKYARCRPDLYTPARQTVWVDAAARLYRPDSIERLVEAVGDDPIGMFVHPVRNNLEAEVTESETMQKYAGQPMRQQVAAYRLAGLPGTGLWATGCIVRNASALVRDLGDRWLSEMWRWGWQDQLSLPFVLWEAGVNPLHLPGDLWDNPIIGWSYSQRRSHA
jgi:hypothetical protein